MSLRYLSGLPVLLAASSALAAPGDPVALGSGLALDPAAEIRLRREQVDSPTLEAEAVTLRLRAGIALSHETGLSALVETEGSLAAVDRYNAFAFAISDRQRRPRYAVVADPMTVEVNRLQLAYRSKPVTVTLGRQRINLDDQRFVGSVGWRQNEQTFDALRGEVQFGPVMFDGTYALAQRTVLGADAGSRKAYDGQFVFLGAGARLGPVQAKGFAYLLDFDPAEQVAALAVSNADTATLGLRLTGDFSLAHAARLTLAASLARQSGWKDNPARGGLDYRAVEAGLGLDRVGGRLVLTAGYERLGGNGLRAFQTPMATLHKFSGWADQFLVTPAHGLQDWYFGVSHSFPGVRILPGLQAAVVYHRFASASSSAGNRGGRRYGDEWDASLGFGLGRVNLLGKYANYQASGFGSDVAKFWLQAEVAF